VPVAGCQQSGKEKGAAANGASPNGSRRTHGLKEGPKIMLDITNLSPKIQFHVGRRPRPRKYRSARRHFQGGLRAAVIRAVTAAQIHLEHGKSLADAALRCGSNPHYVHAAVIVLQSEDKALLHRVLSGDVSLLAAAKQVQQVAKLVAAHRKASAADRVAYARTIGPTVLFDDMLVPAIDGATAV
jgi:hypothetical protein